MINYSLLKLKSQIKKIILFYALPLFCQSAFDEYQELIRMKKNTPVLVQNSRSGTISFSLGKFNIKREVSNYIDVAYSLKSYLNRQVVPSFGLLMTNLGSCYCYGSIHTLLPFGVSRFALKPGFNAGYYFKGNGHDLGYPIEFFSSIALIFRGDLLEYGLRAGHISNAHLGSKNPGLELVGLFFNFRFS